MSMSMSQTASYLQLCAGITDRRRHGRGGKWAS